MQKICRPALGGELQGLGDCAHAHAVKGGLFAVHHIADLGLGGFDIPVEVHDALGAGEDSFNCCRERDALRFIRPVDFCHERLQHRRSGWYLGDHDDRAVFFCDWGNKRANTLGNGVALVGPLALADQVDLDVGDIGPASHEVVTHKTVKVKRCSGAGVDLEIPHFGFLADGRGHLGGDAGGLFQCGALRSIDDDLKLRLIVEGQHLDGHRTGQDETEGNEEQADDAGEENPPPAGAIEQGPHYAKVKTGEPVIGCVVMIDGLTGRRDTARRNPPPQHADRGPWRNGESDDQREQHRRGRADGNGPHVGPHQAADEGHGENRCDDGPGCEDGGIADFGDRIQCNLADGFLFRPGQADVPHDIFHHDNRIIHQDADGENQREERDAVERVTIEIDYEQGQGEGGGDREEDDQRFAPAEEKQDQQGDAEYRDAHVQE